MPYDINKLGKQFVRVINATNPAYHEKGDVLEVIEINGKGVKTHDVSGGAVYYSFEDVDVYNPATDQWIRNALIEQLKTDLCRTVAVEFKKSKNGNAPDPEILMKALVDVTNNFETSVKKY